MNRADAGERATEGHPRGLIYLGLTELWERFSYYGMTALLALYMTKQLLTPGHAEHVIGLAALRHVFEFRGPMSDQAFASLVYGWYAGLVYFTPIVGGWVADRWLGVRWTVVLGAMLMSAGHLAMAFDETFLFALSLLILGSGCLKGNIAAQVGTLYPADAESRRARGFAIFSTAINIGAVAGPLVTGAAAQGWGWHAGFGIAAVLMLVALATYLAGQRHFPEPRRSREDLTDKRAMTVEERRQTWALVGLIASTAPYYLSYSMIWNIGVLWIDRRVSLTTPFGRIPPSWFNALDAFASVVIAAPLVALWAWQARRGREPGSIAKIAIGGAITGGSALLLAAGALAAGPDAQVNVLWPLAAFAGMGIAFMWYWPVLLAIVSEVAPPRVTATMMGGAYIALFVGTTAMGWVGSFADTMSDTHFWVLDGAIALAASLVLVAVRGPLSRVLALPSGSDS